MVEILKGRAVIHHTADSKVVENATDSLTTEELNGLFFADDDEQAEYHAAAQIYTVVPCQVWIQAFEIYRFDDGSTLSTRATASISGEISDIYRADIEVIHGTGRFAGLRGAGHLEGWSNGYNARHDIEITFAAAE